jgi:MFS family permease
MLKEGEPCLVCVYPCKYFANIYFLAAYAAALVAILLIGSWPVDKFGRKPALWAVQVFMMIAAIIEIVATNWKHWLVAKILNVGTKLRRRSICNSVTPADPSMQGFSVGLNHMTATTYISEIAPTRARGAALGLYQLFVSQHYIN